MQKGNVFKTVRGRISSEGGSHRIKKKRKKTELELAIGNLTKILKLRKKQDEIKREEEIRKVEKLKKIEDETLLKINEKR